MLLNTYTLLSVMQQESEVTLGRENVVVFFPSLSKSSLICNKLESHNHLGWKRPLRPLWPTLAKPITKPCSQVPHLHIFEMSPGTVTQPLP